MKTALLITTNDEIREIEFEHGLNFFYKNINCNLIEIAYPRALYEFGGLSEKFIMVVDEEGLLRNEPKLNIYASTFHGSPIFGNMMIVKDGGEDFEGLEKEDHKELASAIHQLLNLLELQYTGI